MVELYTVKLSFTWYILSFFMETSSYNHVCVLDIICEIDQNSVRIELAFLFTEEVLNLNCVTHLAEEDPP